MLDKKMPVKKGLKIIIVGCGKVGTTLMERLIQEGHEITIIDRDAEKIQALSGLYDIMGLVGNGASYSVQMEADIENADLLIAVTDSDELNLLCCTVAKRVGDCAAIARVRTPDYSREVSYLREKLGLAMIINPELEASREAARILYLPTALEVNSFAHGQVDMVEFKIPEGNILDGMMVSELSNGLSTHVLICAVKRGSDIYIPTGNFILQRNDVISVVGAKKLTKNFLQYIGCKSNKVKDTLIIGGGKAAYYLASQLIVMGISVKIIERNRKRCEELSELLPQAIIIHGDGTDEELLREEGIEYVESFVPLTGIDEENILLTLYANQVSKAKVITKINRLAFQDVIASLNLGSIIYPRYVAAEAIIRYVRAKTASMGSNIETLYHMYDHQVEAIEFRIDKESKITDIPLADLSLKSNLLIAFINRNGKIIIPHGQSTIQVGDTVMIVTTNKGFRDISDILM